MFDRALERAQQLDTMREKGQLAGPLHGLPVSIKDGFQIAGVPATLGLLAFIDHVSESDASVVSMLLDLGAVLYVKTNISQTLMVSCRGLWSLKQCQLTSVC
jgi:amidase